MAHLVELSVKQRNYIDNVNGSLSLVWEGKTDLCPELRVLRLAYNSPPDSQIVLNMLNSLCSGCMAGLESFHLVLIRAKPVVHLQAGLKVLQDQGLSPDYKTTYNLRGHCQSTQLYESPLFHADEYDIPPLKT
jgi:hypothetical protein